MLKITDKVKVTFLTDETGDSTYLNREGVVVYLNENNLTGNTSEDPLYTVSFDDGTSDSFWREELTLIE